jgi:hypothetical protein
VLAALFEARRRQVLLGSLASEDSGSLRR